MEREGGARAKVKQQRQGFALKNQFRVFPESPIERRTKSEQTNRFSLEKATFCFLPMVKRAAVEEPQEGLKTNECVERTQEKESVSVRNAVTSGHNPNDDW
jgi:hypothetical protein